MAALPLLLAVLLLGVGCRQYSEQSNGVRLLLNTQEIGPGTTFELRFDEPMTRSSMVGVEVENSPLVFKPHVRGRFVYTSSRSGLFTPDEALTLGVDYQLSLRPGLQRADGQPARATLRRGFHTPPFGIVSCQGNELSTNAYSLPEFRIWFNADVKAEDIELYAGFANAKGFWAPADVQQGTEEQRYAYAWSGGSVSTWRDQFLAYQQEHQRRRMSAIGEEVSPTNEIGNLVIITPRQSLCVARGWKLVLRPKLPSADGRLHLDHAFEAQVGDVTPFTLVFASSHHIINQNPRVDLDFSKRLDPNLTNSFTNWVQISPRPADLEAEVVESRLSLSGSWRPRTNYNVTLRRGFPSAEAFNLAPPKTFTVTIPSVDPRLYFAAFSTEQFAGGGRAFPLLAVNVSRIRVQAKLLDSPTAIHALRGYASYFRAHGRSYWVGDGYDRVDYNLVPGRTVFSQELAGTKQEDVAEEIKLEWNHLLPGRKTGIVFLEAERVSPGYNDQPVLGTQALIQLTDLGLVWKSDGTQLQAFVFSYDTGQPVPGARVQLYSDENDPLWEATTDASGLASLNTHTNATWLMIQSADDLHAVKLQEHNISTSSLGMSARWEIPGEGDDIRRVALFTDRDVYRPAETVQLKAIVRDLTEAGLTIPAGLTSAVVCADAQSRQFFTTNLVLSALGACAAAIPLPPGPRGTYEINLTLDGRNHKRLITVADYQPASFEIILHAKRSYAPDEIPKLPVSAHYLFGKSLNRARVQWSLEAQDHPFNPKGFDAFTFVRTSAESQWGSGPGTFAASGQGQITEHSNCVITAEVPLNPASPQPRAVSLLVEVTDLNQQTLTRSANFLQHSSSFYLGLKLFEQVVETGKELPIEIAAVDADQKPCREPVNAKIYLKRVDWQTVRVQGAGRAVRYRSEALLTNLLEREVTVLPPFKLADVEEGFVGSRVQGLLAPAAGEYLLEVTARDAGGHEVSSSIKFNVTENAQRLAWNYPNDVQIRLLPDKPLYEPDDTALILVKTPISGTAWVTVECDRILRSFTTQLEGNAPAVRVPITATDAPNVFVSVTLLRGAADCPRKTKEPDYRVGYCQLNVEDPNTRLQVKVTAASSNHIPGETVMAQALVTDSVGKPVSDAEVTLYAVDEGVLSLTGYLVPDLHAVMFAQRRLTVNSAISLPFLLPEDPEQLTFQNKGYLGGGGGNEKLRKRFLACAFWNASLRSGPDGMVAVQFTAPDSLTRYRLIAVAQTAASQFGSGHSDFTISKPLIVEPALPRFANITDCIQARAVVLNQTDHEGEVLVTLELDDKATALEPSKLSQRIHVAAHGSAIMEVPVSFVGIGSANWNWRARFADISATSFTDAVRSTLKVGSLMPLLREVDLVRVMSEETNLLASINPQLLAGEGAVTVAVANTRLVSLGEAVSQLLHYPYGCAEQTGSSLLPWVLLQETPELLTFTGQCANEAAATAKAGIQRLFSMQTQSGGLAYWPGGQEPMLWASAYGGFVLALARQAGFPVPEDKLRVLMDYLSAQLRDQPDTATSLGDRCLALYALALAEKAEPAYHESLFQQRELLSSEDRALLALAVATSHGNSRMAEDLLQTNAPPAQLTPNAFTCVVRERAMRLLGLLACRPNDPETHKLFAQLQRDQKRSQQLTTQGNAWALLARQQYLRNTEPAPEPGAGTLIWGGQRTPFQLDSAHSVFTHTFRLHPAAADQSLRLASSSKRPLFAQVTVESRSQLPNQVREDHGLSLQRSYARLSDDNEPRGFDTLRVGDRVLVTLRLTVQDFAQYVAVDDPLPSVLEAVMPEFKTQQITAGRPPAWMSQDDGDFWWSDFREIRTDRVLFFGNYVLPGSYLIRYVARVRAAGVVTAPPAKAEEMYHPERFGLTETRVLTSQALE